MVDEKNKIDPKPISYALPEHLAARHSAQQREGIIQIVGYSMGFICFILAGALLPTINKIRTERQLVINPDKVGTLPPDLALLGKLGTFRALAIDWASIRASRLQEEGKYYEALQLHRTVCDLAPRFPTVWSNAAWNMAYNISVAQYTPEARWQWVRNGLTILRDEGIVYNPHAVALYKELSWIYWHKIGDFLDDHHLNYKRAFAVEMERVLGSPPITLKDEDYFSWFKEIVDAQRDLKGLIASDQDVERLVFLLDALAIKPDISLLDFVARNIRPELSMDDLRVETQTEDSVDAQRLDLLKDPKNAQPLKKLLATVRYLELKEHHKLDPDFMYELMERYGPLDWRNAFVHSLYWACLGDRESQHYANLSIHDQLNNARFVLIGLQNLVVKGQITLWPNFDDPFSSYIEMTPDTRYIPFLHREYMRLGKEYFADDPNFREGTPGPKYLGGFITAMQVWIQLLYMEGGERNLDQAANFFAWLREFNRHPDGSEQKQYTTTLDQFVMGELKTQLIIYKTSNALIRSMLDRGLKQFALRQNRAASRSFQLAHLSYKEWEKDLFNDVHERRLMPPFDVMVRDQIERFMTQTRVAPLYKATLWKNILRTSPKYGQMTYDRLRPYFQEQCNALDPPWDVTIAFPEPPAMETYRKNPRNRLKKRPSDIGAEEGSKHKG